MRQDWRFLRIRYTICVMLVKLGRSSMACGDIVRFSWSRISRSGFPEVQVRARARMLATARIASYLALAGPWLCVLDIENPSRLWWRRPLHLLSTQRYDLSLFPSLIGQLYAKPSRTIVVLPGGKREMRVLVGTDVTPLFLSFHFRWPRSSVFPHWAWFCCTRHSMFL